MGSVYFMYVDECGDPGPFDPAKPASVQGTSFFILTGFIVPAQDWRNYLSAMVEIRRHLKAQFGFPIRAELHGQELVHARGNRLLKEMPRRVRTELYRQLLEMVVRRMPDARLLNIYANKTNLRSPAASADTLQERAWMYLIQRFENFLSKRQEPALGLVFSDETNEANIRKLLRRMRVYNPVPSQFAGYRMMPIVQIVEDPIIRQSRHSYFVQIADLCAHALYRRMNPRGSLKRFNIDRLFEVLQPLLLREASRSDEHGIVYL